VDFVNLTRKLPTAQGQWLAMKGPSANEELRDLPDGIQLKARHTLNVPFETAQRQLLILTPQGVE
jgi:16S rRNA (guanine527-N7)-methyltransferase